MTAVYDQVAVSSKWVNELDPGVFESASFASDDGQVVRGCSRSHETVLARHASTALAQVGQHSCPGGIPRDHPVIRLPRHLWQMHRIQCRRMNGGSSPGWLW